MFRSLRDAIVIVMIVNVLAAGAFAGWLYATDRLNRERVRDLALAARSIFRHTITEQAEHRKEARGLAEQARANEQRIQSILDRAAEPGAMGAISDELAAEQQQAEIERLKIERLEQAQELFQMRNMQMLAELERREQALDERTKAFEAWRARTLQEVQDKAFEAQVATFRELRGRQVKEIFQAMLADGGFDEVVGYMMAMNSRKRAEVLKEFKQPQEIEQAKRLIQGMGQMGVGVDDPPVSPGEVRRPGMNL